MELNPQMGVQICRVEHNPFLSWWAQLLLAFTTEAIYCQLQEYLKMWKALGRCILVFSHYQSFKPVIQKTILFSVCSEMIQQWFKTRETKNFDTIQNYNKTFLGFFKDSIGTTELFYLFVECVPFNLNLGVTFPLIDFKIKSASLKVQLYIHRNTHLLFKRTTHMLISNLVPLKPLFCCCIWPRSPISLIILPLFDSCSRATPLYNRRS